MSGTTQKMPQIERHFLLSFLIWLVLAWVFHWVFLPNGNSKEFLFAALLCAANLGSLGKLFANLAEAVSSVDANRKKRVYAQALIWAGAKVMSLLAILAMLIYWAPQSKSSIFLGLSGWIFVPLLFGFLEIRSRRL